MFCEDTDHGWSYSAVISGIENAQFMNPDYKSRLAG